MSKCVPGTITGNVPDGLPEDEHVWEQFFWSEQDCEARRCLRCLRLEWNRGEGYVEAPLTQPDDEETGQKEE